MFTSASSSSYANAVLCYARTLHSHYLHRTAEKICKKVLNFHALFRTIYQTNNLYILTRNRTSYRGVKLAG